MDQLRTFAGVEERDRGGASRNGVEAQVAERIRWRWRPSKQSRRTLHATELGPGEHW